MAYTLSLSDGTTTYNLLDGANTFGAKWSTLDIGVPEASRVTAQSILRTGFDITAHAYSMRTVVFLMSVTGTSVADLTTNVQNITDGIRKARVWAMTGVGSKWRLKFNAGGTAKDVYFTVRDGEIAIPPGALNSGNLAAAIMTDVSVTLTCDPLAEGDTETVENFVKNPGFEVAGTALADWTESKSGNGTTSRDTSVKKDGDASLKLVMTSSASGQVIERNQALADVDAAEVWSFQCWVRVDALNNCKVVLGLDYNTGTDVEVSTTTVNASSFVKLTANNNTVPGSVTSMTLRLRLEATGSSATGTAYVDNVIAVQAAAVPDTWVSSRDVYNNMDEDDQAGVNYVDIHDVPGDQPAKLQLKLTENENHTKIWAGARHDTRQYDAGIRHEGEDFATWGEEPSDATASDGYYGRIHIGVGYDAVSSGQNTSSATLTVSHTCQATHGNRLLIVGVMSRDASETVPSGVTYDAVSMTRIGSAVRVPNQNEYISLWHLVAPATGANNVVITFSSACDEIGMGVLSFYGVHQSTPIGTSNSDTGSTTSESVGIASVESDLVVDILGLSGGIDPTAGAGQTARMGLDNPEIDMSTELATGTTTTMSWTFGLADSAILGVAIKPINRSSTAASPTVVTKSVSAPPQGIYRVLARVRSNGSDNFKVAMGHAYGGVTVDPSVSTDYGDIPTTQSAWHILDIGSLVVPPASLPEGATIGTLTLRIAFYNATNGNTGESLDVDWVLLLPVDGGVAYASKAAATNVVVLDTVTNLASLSLWDTSDIFQSRPEQRGGMVMVDPGGTRVYLVDDDGADAGIAEGWKVAVKVVPQYLHVG